MEKRILVVEDEGILAYGLKQQLKQLGYTQVAIASSGEQAINTAREFNPDLILMDIFLEGELDGIEAAHKLQSEFDVPIIYTSAYSYQEYIKNISPSDKYYFLEKPFLIGQLKEKIEQSMTP